MPYIQQIQRDAIALGARPMNAGELNYKLTHCILEFFGENLIKYEHINAAIGALECCKLELYRRLAAPYEDVKIEQNGDVYPCSTKT